MPIGWRSTLARRGQCWGRTCRERCCRRYVLTALWHYVRDLSSVVRSSTSARLCNVSTVLGPSRASSRKHGTSTGPSTRTTRSRTTLLALRGLPKVARAGGPTRRPQRRPLVSARPWCARVDGRRPLQSSPAAMWRKCAGFSRACARI